MSAVQIIKLLFLNATSFRLYCPQYKTGIIGSKKFIFKGTNFEKHIFEELEEKGFGKWGFADNPQDMAKMIIAHIEKKREALGINKKKERVLMDMAMRRELEGGTGIAGAGCGGPGGH